MIKRSEEDDKGLCGNRLVSSGSRHFGHWRAEGFHAPHAAEGLHGGAAGGQLAPPAPELPNGAWIALVYVLSDWVELIARILAAAPQRPPRRPPLTSQFALNEAASAPHRGEGIAGRYLRTVNCLVFLHRACCV